MPKKILLVKKKDKNTFNSYTIHKQRNTGSMQEKNKKNKKKVYTKYNKKKK